MNMQQLEPPRRRSFTAISTYVFYAAALPLLA